MRAGVFAVFIIYFLSLLFSGNREAHAPKKFFGLCERALRSRLTLREEGQVELLGRRPTDLARTYIGRFLEFLAIRRIAYAGFVWQNGWKCFEAPDVDPVFAKKDDAIGYAQTRARFRTGEIRVLDSTGNVGRLIAFDEAGRRL